MMRCITLKITLFIITLSLLASCNKSDNVPSDYVVASVNGENILYSEIEYALNSLGEQSITFDTILRNSINELIVVQMATKYKIEISDEDFTTYLKTYRDSYPQFFEKGIELYGSEEQFIEGLYRQRLFTVVRKHLQDYVLEPVEITENEINDFYLKNSLDVTLLSEEEQHEVVNRIKQEKEDIVFFNWMLEQWKHNDVKVYYGSYQNTTAPK